MEEVAAEEEANGKAEEVMVEELSVKVEEVLDSLTDISG